MQYGMGHTRVFKPAVGQLAVATVSSIPSELSALIRERRTDGGGIVLAQLSLGTLISPAFSWVGTGGLTR